MAAGLGQQGGNPRLQRLGAHLHATQIHLVVEPAEKVEQPTPDLAPVGTASQPCASVSGTRTPPLHQAPQRHVIAADADCTALRHAHGAIRGPHRFEPVAVLLLGDHEKGAARSFGHAVVLDDARPGKDCRFIPSFSSALMYWLPISIQRSAPPASPMTSGTPASAATGWAPRRRR